MKIKVLVIDLEMSSRAKRVAIQFGVPVGILVAGWASGMPSVAARGGSLGNLTLAGVFTFSVTQSPLAIDATVGFRCVIPR